MEKAVGAGSEEKEDICRRKYGKWRCKNASVDNEKHHNLRAMYSKDVKEKKISADPGSGPIEDETREWRRRRKMKVMEEEDDTSISETVLDHYKTECVQVSVELEVAKKELELTKIKMELEKKTAATDDEYWRNKCSDLENLVLTLEIEYLFMRSGDGEVAVPDPIEEQTRESKRSKNKKNVTKEKDDGSDEDTSHSDIDGGSANVGIKTKNKKKLPPDEQRCGRTSGGGWRCKNFRMGHDAAADDNDSVPKTKFCEKHYNLNAKYNGNRKKKVPEEDDEQRCGRTGFRGWRCKNLRMGHGAGADDDNVRKSEYCEKHYNFAEAYKKKKLLKKKTSADGSQGSRTADTSPVDTIIECTRRRKKVTEEDNRSLDLTGSMQPAASDDTSGKRKRKNVESAEDDRFIYDSLGDFEDFDGYVDSENSVGDLMDMLGMENWDWSNEEMKWKSEADILSSFEEDPVLLYS